MLVSFAEYQITVKYVFMATTANLKAQLWVNICILITVLVCSIWRSRSYVLPVEVASLQFTIKVSGLNLLLSDVDNMS